VSTTISPVTQTAEVDVNSAVVKSAPIPSAWEIGNINSSVPRVITVKKPKQIVRATVMGGSTSQGMGGESMVKKTKESVLN
jgi:hypothetical protein